MGPLPYDQRSRQFIVMVMDVYSRYLIAIAVKDHTAQTVSKCLYKNVVEYFGVPWTILSDRGAEFTGLVWQSLLGMLGADKLQTSYYPQGNVPLSSVAIEPWGIC